MKTRLVQLPLDPESASELAAGPTLQPLSLRHAFTWTLVGMLAYAACQWGILVALARLGNPVMLGQFALALAIAGPIMLLSGLSLRTVQATDHAQDVAFGDYLGLQFVTITLAMMILAVVTALSGEPWPAQAAILLVGLAKAFELVSDLFYGLLQRHDQMDRVGKSLVIKGLASLLVVTAGIYFGGSVVWAAAGMALSWGLMLLAIDLRNGIWLVNRTPQLAIAAGTRQRGWQSTFRPRWRLEPLKFLCRLALPLGLTTLLSALIINLPRYFIKYSLGDLELGIFAALAYFTIAGNVVASALAQAALPKLSRYYATGQMNHFRRLLVRLLICGAVLGALGILLALGGGRELLGLLYGAEYGAQADVFLVLMISLSFVFPIFFLDYALYAARRFRAQVPINLISVALTAIGSLLLIPRFGLLGAAWVICLVMAVQMLVRGVLVWNVAYGPNLTATKELPAELVGNALSLSDG